MSEIFDEIDFEKIKVYKQEKQIVVDSGSYGSDESDEYNSDGETI